MAPPISPLRSPFVAPTTTTSRSSGTTPQTSTRPAPSDNFVSGSRTSGTDDGPRRAARDTALSNLSSKSSFTVEGETYDLNELLGGADLASERKPFEDRINALYNQSPPLSPAQITAESQKIQTEWEETGAMLGMMVESMLMQIFQQSLPKPGFGMISG